MREPPQWVARPLGAFLRGSAGPTLAVRGLGAASLVNHWPEIVGAAVAEYARPNQLRWPQRGANHNPEGPVAGATLALRIDGAFALEAQHASASIVARVNAHLGWRCVERLSFSQGPLEPPRTLRARPAPPSERALRAARELGAAIVDDDLREALARLGARVIDNAARGR